MSYQGADDDVDIEEVTEINIDLTRLTASVRAQLLKDARRLGNLYGPTAAQKKAPLASQPQSPGTQRIW